MTDHGHHVHTQGHAGAGHDHGGAQTIDWADEADRLRRAAEDDREWYAEVAAMLWRPEDALAVDFACGGAGMAAALAEHNARRDGTTRIVGVDAEPAMVAGAAARLPGVTFITGTLEDDPEDLRAALDGSPDLIWARNALHHARNAQDSVDTLAALLAPGGRLVLAEGGLPARHLPYDLGIGRPGLEDGLDAATHRRYREVNHHVRMPHGWPETLARAGLTEVTSPTLLVDQPAPLNEERRTRVIDILARRVDGSREHLDAEDLEIWDRLLDPADEQWLGRRRDLFRLDARTVHIGHKPA